MTHTCRFYPAVEGAQPFPDTLVDPLPGEAAGSAELVERAACGSPAADPREAPARATPTEDVRIGTVVADRWALMKLLGRGSSGAVYEGCPVEPGAPSKSAARIAVKVLHDPARATHEATVRFVREAHTVASLEHPHVVRILETGRDEDGSLYQVQELLEGEDLSAALGRGPLPVDEAVSVGRQMLDALAAVHAAGFVHRDVKPENVFLTRDEDGAVHAKLLDFGIAKHLLPEDEVRAITMDGVVLGTPHYMSPEQVMGEELTTQADLWALGAVLFHALTGRCPFHDDQIMRLVTQIICEPAPSLLGTRPDLPLHVVEAVDRALMRDPTLRWQTASEMASALGDAAPTSTARTARR